RECLADPGARFEESTTLDLGSMPAPPGVPALSTAPSERIVKKVGRYELLEQIGEGGMGVVYRAEDPEIGQIVALKMISAKGRVRAEGVGGFGTEGQALARLRHPNVVRFYHFDEHEGRPYYTMELVGGGSLERKLTAGPLPLRETAGLVRTLALAIHAVHL